MRRALLLTASLALIAAPSASAATRHVVRGAGWGHGIGMSQYGAYGYALKGSDYREILAHYYSHTRLSSAPARPVRVLLQPDDPYIRFRGATSAGGRRLRPGRTYVARRSGFGIVLHTAGGKRVGRFRAPLRVKAPGRVLRLLGPALNGVSDGLYRGEIEMYLDGGLTAINVIGIDSYIRGVVAGEMPSSWPLESLKAQAVAARTYALATRKTDAAFDLYPDTRSQVYRGVAGESVRSNAAVEQTAGRILTYGGQPAITYYFSTSGGHTESIQFSFLGALSRPWLVGVSDPYDYRSPHHRWQVSFSTATLTRALGARGRFRRLDVTERGTSPRVVSARVVGTRGSTTLSGPAIRERLGLRDTWMRFMKISSSVHRPLAAFLSRGFFPWRWGGERLPPNLTGSFTPAPHGRTLTLERHSGGRWRKVTSLRTTRRGRYRVAIDRAGTYRVRHRTVAGPQVRVR
jgi:stage II sporulation protein D